MSLRKNLEKPVAAAAKSRQSCMTLSDSMDCSLPGSSVHGIFQARVPEWVALAFSKRTCVCVQNTHPHYFSLVQIYEINNNLF